MTEEYVPCGSIRWKDPEPFSHADLSPYFEEIRHWIELTTTAIEVDATMTDFIEDGGEPWLLLAGERALLGREISPTEVATDLLALT